MPPTRDYGPRSNGVNDYGLSTNGLRSYGPYNGGPKQTSNRRRAQIRRRRLTALGMIVLVVVVAVAVPVASRGGEAGGPALLDETAVSGSVSAEDPASSGSGEFGESGQPGYQLQQLGAAFTSVAEAVRKARETAIAVGANEMGRIPVLMYHKIGEDVVPPARLRDDIARLKAAGFYPTTVRDMAEGTMDIPAGKSPVILTFDDSSPTHYKIREDGSMDPDCAVAILLAESSAADWAAKASFFPLLYLETSANIVFGQPEYAEKKLRDLVLWGFEVGSHTVDHLNLSQASPEHIRKELAESESRLEEMIGGGYQIYTLSPPYGEYPADVSLLTSGEYEGVSYDFEAAVRASGGYSASPFSTNFDPMRIPRVSAYKPATVAELVWYFREYPEMRFVSDGDPEVIAAPAELAPKLGTIRADLAQMIVRY